MSTSSWGTQCISPAGQKATQSLPLSGCTTSKSDVMSRGVAKVFKRPALQWLPVVSKAASHNIKIYIKKKWVFRGLYLPSFNGILW